MAQNATKDKSPIRSYTAPRIKKTDGLRDDSNNNIRIAESISCGCSLKSFHDNFSNLAKPTKYKISQIWPLFRHEYAMPATVKKLDRGSRPPSAKKGFIRSPSPQQQRKSPVFSGVSMQRDNYVEISATKDEDDDEHHNRPVPSDVDYDDLIPMGMVVCTAKGSPCCSDPLQCAGAESSKEDHQVLGMADESIIEAFKSSSRARKRLGSASHTRSDDLYAAVEREFKRLGIYRSEKDQAGAQYDSKNGKSATPPFMSKPSAESPHASRIDCSRTSLEHTDDHQSMSFCHHRPHRDSERQADDAPSLLDNRLHTTCHECFDHQHSFTTDYIDQLSCTKSYQHEKCTTQGAADEDDVVQPAYAISRISPDNVVESFVSLSNVLCKSHFASLVRRSEASLQTFTNYLIKAKQRAVFRENPSHTPHKHDITADIISSLMPKVRFESPHHYKYGLQACISKVIFDQFDTQSYGGEVDLSCKINRQFMFLRAYYVLEALDNCTGEQLMEVNEEFQQFCHRQLEAMKRRVGWVTRWPSKLLQAFLLALKDVWVAHKLAFAFEKPASVFFAKPRSPLDLEHMSPLIESSSKQSSLNMSTSWTRSSPRLSPYSQYPSPKLDRNDENLASFLESSTYSPKPNPNLELDRANCSKLNTQYVGYGGELIAKHNLSLRWNGVVQFSVFPGFLLKGEGVLQSIVYLQPKTDNQTNPIL